MSTTTTEAPYEVELGKFGFMVVDKRISTPLCPGYVQYAPESEPGARADGLFSGRPFAALYAAKLNELAAPAPTSPEMARKALEKLYAKRNEGTPAKQQWRAEVIARLEAVID